MLEKIGKVSNPLTIIAIFAGIVEVSGVSILPFLIPQNQSVYVWFLMIFPTILVLLFFGVLVWRPQVLYAPSDYKDESNFMRGIHPASPMEVQFKLRNEVEEAKQEAAASIAPPVQNAVPEIASQQTALPAPKINVQRLRRIETAILDQVAKEYGSINVQQAIASPGGRRFVLDGVIHHPDRTWIVEVKYVSNVRRAIERIRQAINQIKTIQYQTSLGARPVGSIIALGVEYDDQRDKDYLISIIHDAEQTSSTPDNPIHIRAYDIGAVMRANEGDPSDSSPNPPAFSLNESVPKG